MLFSAMRKLPCRLRYSSQQSHKCADWRTQNRRLFLLTSEMPSALYNLLEPTMTLAPTACPTCVFTVLWCLKCLLMHSTHDHVGPPWKKTWEGTVLNIQLPWKISLLVLLWWQSAPFVCCCQTLPQGCTGHKPHAPNLSGQFHQPITLMVTLQTVPSGNAFQVLSCRFEILVSRKELQLWNNHTSMQFSCKMVPQAKIEVMEFLSSESSSCS